VSADVRACGARSASDHLPLEDGPTKSSGRSLEAGEAPQVRQCGSHERQAVSKHLENPVALAADVERRLFDAASLEVPQEGEVPIVVAVAVERPPKA
jgi:hypothetical protein